MATSKIHACMLTMENGEPKVEILEPVTVMGKATEKEGLKAIKDKFGKECPATISKIEVEEDTYEISVEDFLKYAKKVEKKSSNELEEENE